MKQLSYGKTSPGCSTQKITPLAVFLGALAGEECPLEPSGGKWTNAGCVFGPQRAIAWRVLDAQYFGVVQRRRRVFVVASARKGFDPSQVLFEFDSVRRDSPPSRETGQNITPSAGVGFAESGRVVGALCARDFKGVGNQYVGEGKLVLPSDLVGTLDTQCGYEKAAFQSVENGHIVVHGTQDPLTNDVAFPLGRNSGQENAVAECIPLNSMTMLGRPSDDKNPRMGSGIGAPNDPQNTLSCNHRHAAYFCGVVRHLTPPRV